MNRYDSLCTQCIHSSVCYAHSKDDMIIVSECKEYKHFVPPLLYRDFDGKVKPMHNVTKQECYDILYKLGPHPDEKSGVFMSRPIEVIKMGEPLSNSDVIRAATEKGEIYRRGFKDAMKRYKRPTGKWKHIIEEDNDVECPFCGFQEDGIYYNFCPNCGADMMKGSVEE